ncbi:MAG: 4-oxalocrotonate tautomerase [Dehalococcoidia bacterium]|nr:4-oxalocrotonate tautomerase [Dehalococcoidia bacterium]
MPIIRVEMWKGRTEAQKRELARAITNAMVEIAQTTADATIVVFEDIERENWAEGGKLATED